MISCNLFFNYTYGKYKNNLLFFCNFNQYLYLIYCFIAIILNTYIYKLQALGSNTYSYVFEVIYV